MPLSSPAFVFSVDLQRDWPKPPRNRQSKIMIMAGPDLLIMVGVVFCLAGFVKGMVGLGLPTVSLGLLSIIVDLPTAMALLVMPSLATNVWQALAGGKIGVLWRRLWRFLLMAVVMVHLGAQLSTLVETQFLHRCLGTLLLFYAISGLMTKPPQLSPRLEMILGPVCGAINGLLTGLTGTLFVPGVMFLQSIGLPRDALVQAMGMLFAASTASLGLALYRHDLMPLSLGILSAAALLPALIGMQIGLGLRQRLSQDFFRQLFLIALGGLGGYILVM
ncbi:sulfite exporter TauE/SafE family protein [Candidatus Ponderosibacter sp. Uisw_141_02]|jgi:uncharacterized membrane protein YfcA|uniref:sulfite exporter TauE/SafE family protein n=1 Tax=Candidatus Ponderosibacter sp. Uisw_141_02 TaxID=3231000 RepID=UPI003D3930CC